MQFNVAAKVFPSALIMAGAGAFLILDSLSAETVYSENVVAYADVVFNGPGYSLISNPLDAGINSISRLLRNMPNGSQFLKWDANQERFESTNTFRKGPGWQIGSVTLGVGQGAFLWLPETTPVSFVGEPWQLTCLTHPAGGSVSSVWPLHPCGLCIEPCVIATDGVAVRRFDYASQSFAHYEFSFGDEIPPLNPGEAQILFLPQAEMLQTGVLKPQSVSTIGLTGFAWSGSAFSFQFRGSPSVGYFVQRRASFDPTNAWELLPNPTIAAGADLMTVTDPDAGNPAGFYRVLALRLTNPIRNGTSFSFQMRAEEGLEYQISRTSSLDEGGWQDVLTVTGPVGGGVITVTDTNAIGASGYYRAGYQRGE